MKTFHKIDKIEKKMLSLKNKMKQNKKVLEKNCFFFVFYDHLFQLLCMKKAIFSFSKILTPYYCKIALIP